MHDTASPFYLPLRLLHILGAILLLGAFSVALWWKLRADRTGDAAYLARVHRQLRSLDAQIIGPAAIVTFAAGYAMVRFLGGRIADHLFVLFGLIWLFLALGLWYYGMRMLGDKLAEDAESAAAAGQPPGPDYARRSAAWIASAGGAVLFLTVAAVGMVYRIPGG